MNASYAVCRQLISPLMTDGSATTAIALDVGTLGHHAVHHHRLPIAKVIHPNVILVITSVVIAMMNTVLLANLYEQNMLYLATDMKMVA